LVTLLSAPTIVADIAPGFWGDETIDHLAARHAQTVLQACIVHDRHRGVSYAELNRRRRP
jgi:non-ribosomal peptide synthetase component E (peptide arylation enzyme)